jgi:cellulose biosynthesis protein BcsQ
LLDYRHATCGRASSLYGGSILQSRSYSLQTELIDLDAIRRTAQLIKSAEVSAFVVLNAAPHSATTLLEDARAIVEGTGLSVAPIVLRERSAYRAAWPLGKTVTETDPRGKAAREISELQNWIFAQMQMCKPEGAQKRKTVTNG